MQEPLLLLVVACLVTGVAVGWLAGLLGIGGGLIIVPTLVWLFVTKFDISLSLAMPMAIATSLSTILFTGFSSARAHYKLGNLNVNLIVYCGFGVAIGAMGGAYAATKIPGDSLANIFAALVVAVALYMLFGKTQHRETAPSTLAQSVISAGTGGLAAIMGIGGGAIMVPALTWFGVPIRKAIGCAAACGLVVATFGVMVFVIKGLAIPARPALTIGYVYWPATFSIAATSVLFAPLGAKFGKKIDTVRLKKIFAVFLLCMSVRMIWGIS